MATELQELTMLAYKAYGDSAGWKNYQGKPMSTWEELPEDIKKHWGAATEKVRTEVMNLML